MPSLLDVVSYEIEEVSEKVNKLTGKKETIRESIRVVNKRLNLSEVLAAWKNKNFYEIFGLDPHSVSRFHPLNDEQKKSVRSQFKALSKLFHPDRMPNGVALFQLFEQAHNTLVENDKKSTYDLEHMDITFKGEIPKHQTHFSTFSFATFNSNTPPPSYTPPPAQKRSAPEYNPRPASGYAQPNFTQ